MHAVQSHPPCSSCVRGAGCASLACRVSGPPSRPCSRLRRMPHTRSAETRSCTARSCRPPVPRPCRSPWRLGVRRGAVRGAPRVGARGSGRSSLPTTRALLIRTRAPHVSHGDPRAPAGAGPRRRARTPRGGGSSPYALSRGSSGAAACSHLGFPPDHTAARGGRAGGRCPHRASPLSVVVAVCVYVFVDESAAFGPPTVAMLPGDAWMLAP